MQWRAGANFVAAGRPKRCRNIAKTLRLCYWSGGRRRYTFSGTGPQRIEGRRPNVRIRITNTGAFSSISPCGRIDAVTCPELQVAVDELIDGGETRILLDLQEAVYISSAGLRVILNAAKRLHGSGQIAISGALPKVRHVLDVAGIPDVIDIYPDPESAHAAFTSE
jgi:anti-anti-sigma factor